MNRIFERILNKIPYVNALREQVMNQGAFPAGHYYSPIPEKEDVNEFIKFRNEEKIDFPDINLNKEKQFELLKEFEGFYGDLPFSEIKRNDFRYYYKNSYFGYSDAIFFYCFLRKKQPRKIVEVGSGFSSAVLLDTVERFFPFKPDVYLIDPYPERLRKLLKKDDESLVTIIEKKVQKIPIEIFFNLESCDLLFIDSSHVMKCSSDLNFIMFNVLPYLKNGVFVHFHDIFFPFEYPSEWLKNGWYWNECYLLRAFLSYNNAFSIIFFNTLIHYFYRDFIKEKMPLCIKNQGASLYLQKNNLD